MRRSPGRLAPESGQRWMASYLDVLTILLIFFVAVSAQALHKWQPQPVAPPPLSSSGPPLLQAERKLRARGLDLRREPRGLVISLPQAVLFASGNDEISSSALPMVAEIAGVLHEVPGKVTLAGHADSVPIHNRRFKNNWELATARGLRLLELLNTRYGIPEARLSLVSFGSYRPRGPNDTEDGKASNRRVEIVILDESAR